MHRTRMKCMSHHLYPTMYTGERAAELYASLQKNEPDTSQLLEPYCVPNLFKAVIVVNLLSTKNQGLCMLSITIEGLRLCYALLDQFSLITDSRPIYQ